MPQADEITLHPDFRDFLTALNQNKVEFVLVGAFALAHFGYVRGTGDMDCWIKPVPENAANTLKALDDFGFQSVSLSAEDLLSGDVIQLGFPPVRIDLLTRLTGLETEDIWQSRVHGKIRDIDVCFLDRELLIRNKRTLGRKKDLADIEELDRN